MQRNGLEKMDKRADAVSSSWRVFVLGTFGVIATKLFLNRIAGLFGKGSHPEDAPK